MLNDLGVLTEIYRMIKRSKERKATINVIRGKQVGMKRKSKKRKQKRKMRN